MQWHCAVFEPLHKSQPGDESEIRADEDKGIMPNSTKLHDTV